MPPSCTEGLLRGGLVNSSDVTNDISTQQVDALKESLLRQKSEILNKSAEFKATHLSQVHFAEEAEKASFDVDQNLSIHLHERDRSALHMIERALSRITEGTFNSCESCGDDIGFRRLQARPLTTLCISCMEDQETFLQ